MQSHRRKAPEPRTTTSNEELAAAYYAQKRRTLKERSFDPDDVDAIEAALGRPLDDMERPSLPRYKAGGQRVSIELINGSSRVWPIQIDIPPAQAARREALHRHGAAKVDRRGNVRGITPRQAGRELEHLDLRHRSATSISRKSAAHTAPRQRQSHGSSHGSSCRSSGGESSDDGSGSSGDGDGDAESPPSLLKAFRACTGRDPIPGRLCACGCGGSIEHLAKQARWLPSHQQRYNEERDRVGELPAPYRRKPLDEVYPGEHFSTAEYWQSDRDRSLPSLVSIRRQAQAKRSLAETAWQLEEWRRRKGFLDAEVVQLAAFNSVTARHAVAEAA
jgi:hypothetical protein